MWKQIGNLEILEPRGIGIIGGFVSSRIEYLSQQLTNLIHEMFVLQ